jgi:hypothetical protein
MPRLFVLEVPERLPKDVSTKTEEYIRNRMRECGIDAQVIVLDEGWRLTEVFTDGGAVDTDGTDEEAGGAAPP